VAGATVAGPNIPVIPPSGVPCDEIGEPTITAFDLGFGAGDINALCRACFILGLV
jgi:hypothetical protein